MSVNLLRPAKSLEEIFGTVSTEPLDTPEKLRVFYREQLNQVRGEDKVKRVARGLARAYGADYYKAFVMGHPGVGKSTELTRLIQDMAPQYSVIQFSALNDLDPANFKPFDVLLLMMAEVAERSAKPLDEGGAGTAPSDDRLREIWDWFATEEHTRTEASHKAVEIAAGIGVPADSWWTKVLGLFAVLKGEMKYAVDSRRDVVEYRLDRISTLIELANRLLDECNDLLRRTASKEWLIIGEDFDKPGIPNKRIEELFLTYANVFKDLRTHLIFTIPIGLGYSHHSVFLPFPSDRVFSIPDTPVFDENHEPHEQGRNALRAVLKARVSPELFDDGAMERLIVASGGNLRDLFSMVTQAADTAIVRDPLSGRIEPPDVDRAINAQRTEYTRRLGDSPYDTEPIVYEDKAERLVRIYNADPNTKIPDPVLYFLLRSRAVQEFNGENWFGVHPLVVEVLKTQGRLPPAAQGGAV